MKIKPLEDWVCLKKIEYENEAGLYVHNAECHTGKVIACGPGKRIRKLISKPHPFNFAGETVQKQNDFKVRAGPETGGIFPTQVKPEDIVAYSPYGWEERIIDGEKYIFTREASILGLVDDRTAKRISGHTSPEIK